MTRQPNANALERIMDKIAAMQQMIAEEDEAPLRPESVAAVLAFFQRRDIAVPMMGASQWGVLELTWDKPGPPRECLSIEFVSPDMVTYAMLGQDWHRSGEAHPDAVMRDADAQRLVRA